MTTDKALVNGASRPLGTVPSGDTIEVGAGIQSSSGDLHLGVPSVSPARVRVSNTTGLLEWSPDGSNWYNMPTSGAGITTGTAVITFAGTANEGGNSTSVAVTGQAGITSGANCWAWMRAAATADHNEEEHMMVPVKLTCGNVIAGTGFTIYARTDFRLNGTFSIAWAWQ